MRPQVHLIDPGTNSNFNLLPLGIGRIASYCRANPQISSAFDIHLQFLRRPPEVLAESLERPVVVGLAAYVWNFRASMAYAEAIRRRHPDCLIVLGGASIPKRPERAAMFLDANPFVDVLVQGEGEETFADVVLAMAQGRDLGGVAGIAIRGGGGEPLTLQRRPRMTDLNLIPSPFLDGSFDRLYDLHAERITGVILESNRGCPYSCSFCDWGGADVSKIRSFDLDRIKAEIDWVTDRDIPYIFLGDANFGVFAERDLEIAEHIADCRRRKGSPRFMGINWTKSAGQRVAAIAERLSAAGIQAGVTLAAQSFHGPTLAAVQRRNLPADQIESLRKLCHERGIVTYNDLILGLPEETLDSFLGGLDQVMTDNPGDHWVVHLCNILENTEMSGPEYMARYAIETRTCTVTMTLRVHDPDELEEHEVIVVATKSMPCDDWKRAYDVAYLSAALHNFRTAFFIMNFLKARFGRRHTEFVRFVLDEGAHGPVLSRGLDHLVRQRGAILASVARYSPVAELGGFNASPQEALLAIFLDDLDAFYGELRQMVRRFADVHGFELSDDLLDDLITYQSLRVSAWRDPGTVIRRLSHDLPAYFEAVQNGQGDGPIAVEPGQLTLVVAPSAAADRFAHARDRTRGARYTDLLTVEWSALTASTV